VFAASMAALNECSESSPPKNKKSPDAFSKEVGEIWPSPHFRSVDQVPVRPKERRSTNKLSGKSQRPAVWTRIAWVGQTRDYKEMIPGQGRQPIGESLDFQ